MTSKFAAWPALMTLMMLACAASPVAGGPHLPEPVAGITHAGTTANDLLRCMQGQRATLASGHRGGPGPGYPENAMETIARTLAAAPMLIEVDVRAGRDGTLVLMHDADLARTTDGKGKVAELDWDQLQALRLVDDSGTVTDFRIPGLAQALDWMRGRGLLVLDLKEDDTIPGIADAIAQADAHAYAIVNVYTPAQALAFHRIDRRISLIHPVTSPADVEVLEILGVDVRRVSGWTGIAGFDEPDPELWTWMRERGMPVVFGTLFRVDRQIAETGDTRIFAELAGRGVDIMTSDLHLLAFSTLDAGNGTAMALEACGAGSVAAGRSRR